MTCSPWGFDCTVWFQGHFIKMLVEFEDVIWKPYCKDFLLLDERVLLWIYTGTKYPSLFALMHNNSHILNELTWVYEIVAELVSIWSIKFDLFSSVQLIYSLLIPKLGNFSGKMRHKTYSGSKTVLFPFLHRIFLKAEHRIGLRYAFPMYFLEKNSCFIQG